MVDLDQFLRVVFPSVKDDEVVCLADVRPDANDRPIFPARAWRPGRSRVQGATYFCISTVRPSAPGAKLQRTMSDVRRTWAVVLDDIGTKIDPEVFADKAAPHYVMETSPGNFQWGYLLEPSDPDAAAAVIHALALAGYTDKGSQGKNRVVRVPGSVNTKHGQRFVARVTEWFPDDPRWTLEELAEAFGVTPQADSGGSSIGRTNWRGPETPDPVYNHLQDIGYVLDGPNQDGYASIVCPWADEHTDPREDARWAVGAGLTGAFKCFHAACNDRHTRDVLDWIIEDGGPDFGADVAAQAVAVGAKLLKLAPAFKRPPKEPPRGRSEGEAENRSAAPENRPPDATGSKVVAEAPAVARLLAAILDDLPYLERVQLPSCERTAGGGVKAEQKPTAENVGWVAQQLEFAVAKNQLSGEVEIEHPEPRLDAFGPGDRHRLTRELLVSACARVGMNIRGVLQSSLEALASGNSYHPILDWVLSKSWDGIDRLAQLGGTLATKDPAWTAVALRRWSIQCVVAWGNWARQTPMPVPYVLTLVGPQGLGKTSWFRSLLPEGEVQTEASLHLDSMRADDNKRKVLSSAIVELGEIETTFSRSEIGALKAFLSNTSDRYRMPYDRDVTVRVRCTSFGASVNEHEFLGDPTGARRFWPLEVTRCNWRHGLDLQQLWAQAHALMVAGEQWNPTEDESRLHVVIAESHRVVSYAESLLDELRARMQGIDRNEWVFASAAEVAKYYRLENNQMSWRSVGRTLRALFGEPRMINGKRGWSLPIRAHEYASSYVAYRPPIGANLKVVK